MVYYPAMYMTIPIYREPEYVILTSCVPLFFLNLFSLGVFLIERSDYTGRLGLVITVLLALFAFLPTFRQESPLATITSLDLCVFGSVVVMLFVVLDSIFIPSHSWANYFFPILSLLLVMSAFGFILVKYIKYRMIKGEYDTFKGNGDKRYSSTLDIKNWKARFTPKKYSYRADPSCVVVEDRIYNKNNE